MPIHRIPEKEFEDGLNIKTGGNSPEKSTAEWRCRKTVINLKVPAVMGVLNVTPDSFSDGGKFLDRDKAIKHAWKMVEDGAAIIDVGGESSRPGARAVSLQEELDRVIPVIEGIRSRSEIPISIDTYKPEVAREALLAGANIINDISGFTQSEMREIAAESGAGIIIMHMQGTPRTMQKSPRYKNLLDEVYGFLMQQAEKARLAGIKPDQIVIDPGIGFGKRVEHNYIILRNLKIFANSGYPVLVGISRKSLIGAVTDLPVERRLAPSIALNTAALLNGAGILRVHDVKETVESVKVIQAFRNFN